MALIGALLITGPGLLARAQDQPPVRPLLPRTVDDLATTPGLPGLSSESATGTPILEGAQTTQGRVAFQSYRDGNWEIYLGNSDTLGVQRLTSHSSADVEPRLSPDLSQIVFTSKRTGNYELFRMDAAGNGLAQLTNDGATDSAGAWSPDGRRIAFQSNRGDNTDVYVMNADGSGLTRLTSQTGYDGEPAWSPDGTQIAFISRRSSGDVDYFLYLMNADGGNQHLLTPVPYSSRPTWDWRGKRILFDGLDGSGWQRLYVYDLAAAAVRSAGLQPYSANTDDLAGSWGGNDTIYFTRSQYVQYNGQWYISSMQVQSATEKLGQDQRTLFGNVDGFPSWSNPDHVAPTSFSFTSSPALRRGSSPGIWVVASDAGPLGATSVDVQHRSDGGAWTHADFGCVKYNTVSWRCLLFPAEGAQYETRVRAIDGFENKEEWTDDAQAWTRIQLFERVVFGTVRDQTGMGQGRVPVTGIGAIENGLATGATGGFIALQQTARPFTVSATLGGQTASLTSDRLKVLPGNDLWAELRPAPIGNVIANPGFDVAGADWSALNAAAPVWSPAAAEADSPVLHLGWESGLIEPSFSGMSPIVAYSGTTELFLLSPYGYAANLVLCPLNGTCATEYVGNGIPRELSVAADGTLGVILGDYYTNQVFLTRSPSGIWSQSTALPGFGSAYGQQLLPDHQGRWHLLWFDGVGVVHMSHRNAAGVWSDPVEIQAFPYGWRAALDAADVVHVVGCTMTGVSEITWSAAQGFGLPIPVSDEICSGAHQGTHIDTAGQIYVVWSLANGESRYSRRSVSGTWGPVVPLTGAVTTGRYSAAGAEGRPILAVNDPTGAWAFREASADGAGWSALPWRATWASSPAAYQLRAIDPWVPSVTVVDTASSLIVLRARLTGLETTTGAQQVVTIPADLNRPLLSTYYRFAASADGDTLTLGIQAADEPIATVLALTAGDDWQRAWRDVSAWAGKTVTVTVRLVDGPGLGAPSADVNEIYLGAWTTPSITTLAPTQFAGPTGTFTLTGDNFMATPTVTIGGRPAAVTRVDGQHLTVSLPADLPPGKHIVLVVNPGGYSAEATPSIQVGYVVSLPALLRWLPPRWP